MKSVWEILGIEETTDTRVIKKAYAKLVRDCHQEDEPERWQELHEAYKLASDYAKRQDANSSMRLFVPEVTTEQESVNEEAEPVQNEEPTETIPDKYTEMFEKMDEEQIHFMEYFEIFCRISDVEFVNQSDEWKKFFEGEMIETYKKDLMFWHALSRYLSEAQISLSAFTYLTEKFADMLKDEKYTSDDNVAQILESLHRKCWLRCRNGIFFLPKKPVKHPYRVMTFIEFIKLIWYLFLFVVLGGAFLVIGFHVLTGQSHKLFGMVWDWICGIF